MDHSDSITDRLVAREDEQLQQLMAERDRMLVVQRKLMEVSTAVNSSRNLDDILLMARDAAISVGGFDRSGAWIMAGESAVGSWGTDADGNLRDEHHIRQDLNQWSPKFQDLRACRLRHYLEEWESEDIPSGSPQHTVPHAVIGLIAGGEMVGMLSVDNLITGRPITEEDLAPLLPFTEHVAVAIQNLRLFDKLHQTQDALLRSEKMRAVGELASGVAHNMNNVLTAVLGYAELIRNSPTVSPEIGHYARIIERAALDGAEITQRLQQSVRSEPASRSVSFDLSEAAQQALDLTRPVWHNMAAARGVQIRVATKLDPGIVVQGTPSEIREVIVNLIRNAADAMPEGGVLSVHSSRAESEATLMVADSGVGLDEETRSRIFEPFFTTKGTGLGLGLGLSVAWGIVERHGGRIGVESACGRGTTFTVTLPLPEAQIGEDPSECSSDCLPGIHLLLVEDEEVVAEGLARMLSASGVCVSLQNGGQEALEWLATNSHRCDVVVSDHGMVGMTGLELLRIIQERYPRLKRVLLSGWGSDLPNAPDTSTANLVLAKPISSKALVSALSELLGSSQTPQTKKKQIPAG